MPQPLAVPPPKQPEATIDKHHRQKGPGEFVYNNVFVFAVVFKLSKETAGTKQQIV
jgi:hypothetical protein